MLLNYYRHSALQYPTDEYVLQSGTQLSLWIMDLRLGGMRDEGCNCGMAIYPWLFYRYHCCYWWVRTQNVFQLCLTKPTQLHSEEKGITGVWNYTLSAGSCVSLETNQNVFWILFRFPYASGNLKHPYIGLFVCEAVYKKYGILLSIVSGLQERGNSSRSEAFILSTKCILIIGLSSMF
jgi:hypothetical protein